MPPIHLTIYNCRWDREVVIRKLDSDSALLRQMRAALVRLEEGTFGICLECEEELPARRLQVLPWAARCVSCQERADRRAAQAGSALWAADEDGSRASSGRRRVLPPSPAAQR
jgi:DnaK suppressor protein